MDYLQVQRFLYNPLTYKTLFRSERANGTTRPIKQWYFENEVDMSSRRRRGRSCRQF
jgi:hypothetical protein